MTYTRSDGFELKFTTLLEDSQNADVFRHFKNKDYRIVTLARHSEDGTDYVVYQALYDDFKCYVRPADMFFAPLDPQKYPEAQQKYRFEPLGGYTDLKCPVTRVSRHRAFYFPNVSFHLPRSAALSEALKHPG